jgi:hypothetical protein
MPFAMIPLIFYQGNRKLQIERVGNYLKFMAFVKWQCSKCGKQESHSAGITPSQSKCPDGGSHVWSKLGRFIKQVFDLF